MHLLQSNKFHQVPVHVYTVSVLNYEINKRMYQVHNMVSTCVTYCYQLFLLNNIISYFDHFTLLCIVFICSDYQNLLCFLVAWTVL